MNNVSPENFTDKPLIPSISDKNFIDNAEIRVVCDDADTFIYVITGFDVHGRDPIPVTKIGITNNLRQRLASIRGSFMRKSAKVAYAIFCKKDDARMAEAIFHVKFNPYRYLNEAYKGVMYPMIDAINSITDTVISGNAQPEIDRYAQSKVSRDDDTVFRINVTYLRNRSTANLATYGTSSGRFIREVDDKLWQITKDMVGNNGDHRSMMKDAIRDDFLNLFRNEIVEHGERDGMMNASRVIGRLKKFEAPDWVGENGRNVMRQIKRKCEEAEWEKIGKVKKAVGLKRHEISRLVSAIKDGLADLVDDDRLHDILSDVVERELEDMGRVWK